MSDEDQEKEKTILDLSKRQLKKVPKEEDAQNVRILILDENELQKIDNIDSYLKIEKLSLSKNQLLRMYGVCRLHCLRELNLSFNGILSIEGLKDCVHLRVLNLEGNNIKTIEHLNNNIKLECLNLSDNSIGSISDISFLKNLKELYLHGNRLTHLRQCDKYLPVSLEVLTLAKNNINDLNEICSLANLIELRSITISENPCVSMTNGPGGMDGFDYRPFVLNWCMSVKVIDGFVVDPIESLKAEWLYSQGRGRQFRLGEQASLAKYLSSVCPLIGKALENENERKLRLILSKAQHHQRQLQEEISENSNSSCNNSPSSGRKKAGSRIQSPRFSRLTGRQGSPDSMISSYHGTTGSLNDSTNNSIPVMQMTTSLIENIKNDSSYETMSINSCGSGSKASSGPENTPRSSTPSQYNDNKMNSPRVASPNLKRSSASSERSPIVSPRKLHTKVSNQSTPQFHLQNNDSLSQSSDSGSQKSRYSAPLATNRSSSPHEIDCANLSSDEDSDNINIDKLTTIRTKAAQKKQEIEDNISRSSANDLRDPSAVMIQKMWRGYRTRKKTKYIAEKLLKNRTQEYIDQLTKDMEMTKVQLEKERKIQQLQMQAINALWKRISTMQTLSQVQTRATANPSESSLTASASAGPLSDAESKVLSLDNNSSALVNDLTKTCTQLTTQVQQLQGSMRDILNCLTIFCSIPQENVKTLLSAGVSEALAANSTSSSLPPSSNANTQTEIIAVHTPQNENSTTFPFASKIRPSTLPLESQNAIPNSKQPESTSNVPEQPGQDIPEELNTILTLNNDEELKPTINLEFESSNQDAGPSEVTILHTSSYINESDVQNLSESCI